MFFKHRADWIRRMVKTHHNTVDATDLYELLAEAWDRGIEQGRKMERKGIGSEITGGAA